ncbi:Arginyl-tRNA synthetase [invertebrate metagenome]|uniref:arginine--tRNA ligase n=1 Tax=invertebrate metagenome TaxID=1711999 RepID=A0A484H9V6_9ZZZZ
MNVFKYCQTILHTVISELAAGGEIQVCLDITRITCETSRNTIYGHITTNIAMVLAKPTGLESRVLAAMIAERLEIFSEIASVTVAGPGFLNICFINSFWHDRLRELLIAGISYGDTTLGAGYQVNIEFVSANPTGPLHIGHGRGAVVGDALAALLEKAGYAVTREYYINDGGTQVDMLARSTYLRYREALGEAVHSIPEGYYPGAYLLPIGRALARRDGKRWLSVSESEWLEPVRAFAVDAMMNVIRADLEALGVQHDVFASERQLIAGGGVETAVRLLAERGLVYEGILEPPIGQEAVSWQARPQVLFRATHFGDHVDRPLKKADGHWAYFASDLAYHLDKYHRGFASMLNIWGADHSGYVQRMQAAVQALTSGQGKLEVKLCQMVNLLDNGQAAKKKMSKRAGTFITLREVIDRVGRDVVRFIMLTRKSDAHLDFDFTRVTEQSRENPVFYVQYAHARACSVYRHACLLFPDVEFSTQRLAVSALHRLTDPLELGLIRILAGWPQLVEAAAEAYEPHRVAYYLFEVAAAFHELWNKGQDSSELRFLLADDPELSQARLALVRGVATVIESGLSIFGVEAVQELR